MVTLLEFIILWLVLVAAYIGIVMAIVELSDWFADHRRAKVTKIEAELDQAQDQMRATILALAGQLGADAHEARKALIRESFLTSGQVPTRE